MKNISLASFDLTEILTGELGISTKTVSELEALIPRLSPPEKYIFIACTNSTLSSIIVNFELSMLN